MKKILTAALLPVMMLSACSSNAPTEKTEAELSQMDLFAMDTYMNLKAYDLRDEQLLRQASERITELENLFSVTIPESDISRINAASGTSVEISADTAAVIRRALEIGSESGGALDITIYPLLLAWGFTTEEMHTPAPEVIAALLPLVDYTQVEMIGNTVTIPEGAMLDLGALAKGYASDAVISLFRENGVNSAIISLGGNVQALGKKPGGSPWTVGVVNPFSPEENMCVLQIENQAVITSGNYERYFEDEDGLKYWHILDSTDGYPADNGLVSVTVIGESGLSCDALSTALFVEGTDQAVIHWKQIGGFEMVCVTEDGRILISEGLQDTFTSLCDMPVEVIVRE